MLYIMYVMYKTVLAGCEGAEWGTGRDWVSCLIPKLTLPWRGSDVTYLRRVDHGEAATRRVLSPSGNSLPALRACLRHLYRVTSEIPSSCASSLIVLFSSGSIFFSTASLLSAEYLTCSLGSAA